MIEHPRSQKITSNFLRVDGLRAWPPANIIALVRKSAKAFLTLPLEAKQNENWINMQTLNTMQTNEKSNIHIVCVVCIHWFTSCFCCLWDKGKKKRFVSKVMLEKVCCSNESSVSLIRCVKRYAECELCSTWEPMSVNVELTFTYFSTQLHPHAFLLAYFRRQSDT